MKVHVAFFVNKASRSANRNLEGKASKALKAVLRKGSVESKEFNTFLLISGRDDHLDDFSEEMIEQIERGQIHRRVQKYYRNYESKTRKILKNSQELHEISRIVENFIREVHPSLVREFRVGIQRIIHDLPGILRQISSKSYIALWESEGEKKRYRVFLSSLDFPIISGAASAHPWDFRENFDKFLITNFFVTFLKPTLSRLQSMDGILRSLRTVMDTIAVRSGDARIQEKFVLFLRILAAKLSSLQELDSIFLRIFNLFDIPRLILSQYEFQSDFQDLNSVLTSIGEDVRSGIELATKVGEDIHSCQAFIRGYLEETMKGLVPINSHEEFRKNLRQFVEASASL
ncbi:MAG TPA: hypothetical protein VJ044_16920, partial [Candidatus Hodarchaeales archaeon]|nr:hypothetical protein [Candidatus Hodarchaeales archaeon]